MRTKKLAVILVAIVFALVMLFSCIALFTVKKIQVNYAVGDNTDTVKVQEKLDQFLGENLIFLKEEDVIKSIADMHYMEIVSIEKSFPNVVKLEIRERKEVYEIVCGENLFITTDNGFILKSLTAKDTSQSRDRIRLELKDVSVMESSLGALIVTDEDELLKEVFEMAKSVQLTNCIKTVELEKATAFNGKATFRTYTGVDIVIRELLDDGLKKIESAFQKYDEGTTDYEKTFNKIVVVKIPSSGEIEAIWTDNEDI